MKPMFGVNNDHASSSAELQASLSKLGRLLVAYSGGVDSAYLAWAAHQALGDGMLAIIADSPSLARTQLSDAIDFAKEQGIPLEVVATSELDRPEYVRNDSQRCFFCKDELFTLMEELRESRGFDAIAYGVNLNDQGDFRPGQKAASNHHVVAPLLDAGLSKENIRVLARQNGLAEPRPIWKVGAANAESAADECGVLDRPTRGPRVRPPQPSAPPRRLSRRVTVQDAGRCIAPVAPVALAVRGPSRRCRVVRASASVASLRRLAYASSMA